MILLIALSILVRIKATRKIREAIFFNAIFTRRRFNFPLRLPVLSPPIFTLYAERYRSHGFIRGSRLNARRKDSFTTAFTALYDSFFYFVRRGYVVILFSLFSSQFVKCRMIKTVAVRVQFINHVRFIHIFRLEVVQYLSEYPFRLVDSRYTFVYFRRCHFFVTSLSSTISNLKFTRKIYHSKNGENNVVVRGKTRSLFRIERSNVVLRSRRVRCIGLRFERVRYR